MKLDDNFIGTILRKSYNWFDIKFLSYYHDTSFIKRLMKEEDFRFFPFEMLLIKKLAERQTQVKGDFAEVGVYCGTSARMINEVRGDKLLWLFDTFEGIPEKEGHYYVGRFKYDYYRIRSKFMQWSDKVEVVKGLFPQETGYKIKNRKFAFVHLDTDIYKSTKDSLEFFYPKMSKGGIILTHDYLLEPVRRAFEEFFKDKSEKPIWLNTQGMVVKE